MGFFLLYGHYCHKKIVELLCKQGGKTGVELKAEGKWNK